MSYSRKLYESRKQHDNERRPIVKGSSHKIIKGTNVMPPTNKGVNLQRFQNTLQKLKDYTDMPTTTTNEDALKQYHTILSIMDTVEDSSMYETLSRMISGTFQDEKMFPGTIGSTISGCHVNFKDAQLVEPGCTPTCAGALKATIDSSTCSHKIYLAEVNGKGGFNIKQTFAPTEISDKAYVYVPRSRDKKFHKPNFDVRTVDYLKSDGVKMIKILGYDAYNQLLVSLHENYLELDTMYPSDEIKKRTQAAHQRLIQERQNGMNRSKSSEGGWDTNTLIVLGLLVLLVIGYVFFYRK